jgi:hypothetical protein
MSVQVRTDISSEPFIRAGRSLTRDSQIILQDAGRTENLLSRTLMAKVAATQKWVPFTDETATNGTAIPQGVYLGDDIAFADIVAGDVTDLAILVGDAILDATQLVIENSLTVDTVITVGATDLRTVRDRMAGRGIFIEDTIAITEFENT